MILLLVLVIVGIIFAMKWRGGRPATCAGDEPLQILRKRYAKGEITKEEFDRVKEDLRGV